MQGNELARFAGFSGGPGWDVECHPRRHWQGPEDGSQATQAGLVHLRGYILFWASLNHISYLMLKWRACLGRLLRFPCRMSRRHCQLWHRILVPPSHCLPKPWLCCLRRELFFNHWTILGLAVLRTPCTGERNLLGAKADDRLCLEAAASQAFGRTPPGKYTLRTTYDIHPQAVLDQLARHTLNSPAPTHLAVSCAALAYHAHLHFTDPNLLDQIKLAAGKGSAEIKESARMRISGWIKGNPAAARHVFANAAMLSALMNQFPFE